MTDAPARYIRWSNLLTYVSIGCGLGAVFVAREFGSWEGAGLLIAVAALSDTFDGRFARRFDRTESERAFGEQLDSLVDAVSFGVVPVVCLHSLVPMTGAALQALWFVAACLYVLCAVTRLGYYNVHHHAQAGFVGLPTTLAALLWSTLFLIHPAAPLTIAALLGIGLAMVSFLPVPRPRGIAMWAYMLWFLAVFVSYGSHLAHALYG